jgi:glycosyltransferase involved in cell wall biosynthesis
VSHFIKKDALVIIGRLGYPGNSAPSNRVHLYCKALKKEKGFPFIINLHSTFTEKPKFNYLARNEGIPFYFAQKTPMRDSRLLVRNFKKIRAFFNTLSTIQRIKKKHDLKVLFYATEPWDEFILFIFLKIMNISIIRECSEIPVYLREQKRSRNVHNFFLQLKVKMYDNLIVISDHLNDFYSELFPKNKIFQIPILVDIDRFKNIELEVHNEKIITYIGYMGGNKDGLENLIEAMLLVNEKNKNVRLQLVGGAPDKDMVRLRNKVDELGLDKTIIFTGKKNSQEVPVILANSDILVLARPNNRQAKAGFPTKLGEYLACAKPVVITTTGEIPKYLKHKESAYLSKPDDINDFADKIIYALSDNNSEAIGKKGYKVAIDNFDYRLYGKKILEMLQS